MYLTVRFKRVRHKDRSGPDPIPCLNTNSTMSVTICRCAMCWRNGNDRALSRASDQPSARVIQQGRCTSGAGQPRQGFCRWGESLCDCGVPVGSRGNALGHIQTDRLNRSMKQGGHLQMLQRPYMNAAKLVVGFRPVDCSVQQLPWVIGVVRIDGSGQGYNGLV